MTRALILLFIKYLEAEAKDCEAANPDSAVTLPGFIEKSEEKHS